MIQYIIPLLKSLLTPDYIQFFYLPVFCLAFIACVPFIMRAFFRR